MSYRVDKPNPNRGFPQYCAYCGGTDLFPDEETDFAWACQECRRVFSVMFHGRNDPANRPAPAPSTAEALAASLEHHGHTSEVQVP